MDRKILPILGIIVLGAIFVGVFINVLNMRVSKGDIYEHYATFRSDPLGASGLYEAFDRLPGVRAEQNLTSLMFIDTLGADTAFFTLGVPRNEFGRIRIPDESPVLKAIKEKGARMVMTINPQKVPNQFKSTFSDSEEDWLEELRKERAEKWKKDTDKKPSKGGKDKEEEYEEWIKEFDFEMAKTLGPRITSRLGVEIAKLEKFTRPDEGWTAKLNKAGRDSGLASVPIWKSQYRFKKPGKAWKVIATVDGAPVVIERKWGKGSIVLATDSFFASNEALYQGANTSFLMWLTGGKKHIVFDETLHGSEKKTGIASMIREYRVHGFILGMLVFVALWAWRSGTSLSPVDEAVTRGLVGEGGTVSGGDNNSGLVTLLKKSIPAKDLIGSCLATWKGSQVQELSPEKQQAIAQATHAHEVDPKNETPLTVYRKIAAVLKKD